MSSPFDDDEATGFEPTRAFAPPPPAPSPPQPTLDGGNALPAGTRLAEFEVLGVVGEGGFGIVYRAWDHSLKRQVALKEYMPSSLAQRTAGLMVSVRSDKYKETFDAGKESFVKEARMLAQFDHPALVKVFRFWEANGSAYMVMPFYEGITLRQELRERKAAPDEATLLGWLGPIADALAVIHAEYYYHRDIAPDNVLLLAGSRRPVLLDFGAARRVIGDMTQDLTVILKPGYAPLEQYAEIPGMKQGPWTDVYALAALAYYAIRGRTPPPSVGRVVNDSYEPLMKVAAGRFSERVLKAIDRALAVRPEQRTPSITAFKVDLGLAPPPADPQAMFPASQPAAEAADLALDVTVPSPPPSAPSPAPLPTASADVPTMVVPPPATAVER
ncbi:MAG: serine/threonine protein kinase, partial [Candidatus Competibacteraceae bacterium]|nr:serine/threonine protein kinase [Candidatus Competibacteraceae bacterium]